MADNSRFACSYSSCNRNFRRQSELNRHIRDAHEEPSRCHIPGCNYEYTRTYGMTVHMRLDHGISSDGRSRRTQISRSRRSAQGSPSVPEPPSLSSRVNEPSRRLQTPTESITPTNTAQTVSHSDPIPIHTPLLSTHVQSSSSRLNADNGDTKSQAADPCWSERASYYSPNKVMLPIRVAQAQSKADGKVEDEEGDYAIPADMEVEIFDDFSANAGI